MEVPVRTVGDKSIVYRADIINAFCAETRGSEGIDYADSYDTTLKLLAWYEHKGHKYSGVSSARRAAVREMGGFWALVMPWLLSTVARLIIEKVVPWLYSEDTAAVQYNRQIRGQK